MPMSGSFPLSSIPANPYGASKFDFGAFLPSDYDWRSASNSMDLDSDSRAPHPSRKLEFVDADAQALGLGGLDITFDAEPSENGKIRVRIHHPGSSSSSPSPSSSSYEEFAPWNVPLPSSFSPPRQPAFAAPSQMDADPFFGVGMSSADLAYGFDPSMLMGAPTHSEVDTAFGRRRVRIALKSMPTVGGEGGEWEVELC